MNTVPKTIVLSTIIDYNYFYGHVVAETNQGRSESSKNNLKNIFI